MKISQEYFNQEVLRFRDMMQDRSSYSSSDDLERLDCAFRGLSFVCLRATATDPHPETTDEQKEAMASLFRATAYEYTRRKELMLGLS